MSPKGKGAVRAMTLGLIRADSPTEGKGPMDLYRLKQGTRDSRGCRQFARVYGFDCAGCQANTFREYYMVRDSIWRRTGMKPAGGMLCIGCLERRIKRPLRKTDFSEALVNDLFVFAWWPKSMRLQMRLCA